MSPLPPGPYDWEDEVENNASSSPANPPATLSQPYPAPTSEPSKDTSNSPAINRRPLRFSASPPTIPSNQKYPPYRRRHWRPQRNAPDSQYNEDVLRTERATRIESPLLDMDMDTHFPAVLRPHSNIHSPANNNNVSQSVAAPIGRHGHAGHWIVDWSRHYGQHFTQEGRELKPTNVVKANGNCLFEAFSLVHTGCQGSHREFRVGAQSELFDNPAEYEACFGAAPVERNQEKDEWEFSYKVDEREVGGEHEEGRQGGGFQNWNSLAEYALHIGNDGEWGDELSCHALANRYGVVLHVFSLNQDEFGYSRQSYGMAKMDESTPHYYLLVKYRHYEVLNPITPAEATPSLFPLPSQPRGDSPSSSSISSLSSLSLPPLFTPSPALGPQMQTPANKTNAKMTNLPPGAWRYEWLKPTNPVAFEIAPGPENSPAPEESQSESDNREHAQWKIASRIGRQVHIRKQEKGTWRCENCACTFQETECRVRGPSGEMTLCRRCGRYWKRTGRSRPVTEEGVRPMMAKRSYRPCPCALLSGDPFSVKTHLRRRADGKRNPCLLSWLDNALVKRIRGWLHSGDVAEGLEKARVILQTAAPWKLVDREELDLPVIVKDTASFNYRYVKISCQSMWRKDPLSVAVRDAVHDLFVDFNQASAEGVELEFMHIARVFHETRKCITPSDELLAACHLAVVAGSEDEEPMLPVAEPSNPAQSLQKSAKEYRKLRPPARPSSPAARPRKLRPPHIIDTSYLPWVHVHGRSSIFQALAYERKKMMASARLIVVMNLLDHTRKYASRKLESDLASRQWGESEENVRKLSLGKVKLMGRRIVDCFRYNEKQAWIRATQQKIDVPPIPQWESLDSVVSPAEKLSAILGLPHQVRADQSETNATLRELSSNDKVAEAIAKTYDDIQRRLLQTKAPLPICDTNLGTRKDNKWTRYYPYWLHLAVETGNVNAQLARGNASSGEDSEDDTSGSEWEDSSDEDSSEEDSSEECVCADAMGSDLVEEEATRVGYLVGPIVTNETPRYTNESSDLTVGWAAKMVNYVLSEAKVAVPQPVKRRATLALLDAVKNDHAMSTGWAWGRKKRVFVGPDGRKVKRSDPTGRPVWRRFGDVRKEGTLLFKLQRFVNNVREHLASANCFDPDLGGSSYDPNSPDKNLLPKNTNEHLSFKVLPLHHYRSRFMTVDTRVLQALVLEILRSDKLDIPNNAKVWWRTQLGRPIPRLYWLWDQFLHMKKLNGVHFGSDYRGRGNRFCHLAQTDGESFSFLMKRKKCIDPCPSCLWVPQTKEQNGGGSEGGLSEGGGSGSEKGGSEDGRPAHIYPPAHVPPTPRTMQIYWNTPWGNVDPGQNVALTVTAPRMQGFPMEFFSNEEVAAGFTDLQLIELDNLIGAAHDMIEGNRGIDLSEMTREEQRKCKKRAYKERTWTLTMSTWRHRTGQNLTAQNQRRGLAWAKSRNVNIQSYQNQILSPRTMNYRLVKGHVASALKVFRMLFSFYAGPRHDGGRHVNYPLLPGQRYSGRSDRFYKYRQTQHTVDQVQTELLAWLRDKVDLGEYNYANYKPDSIWKDPKHFAPATRNYREDRFPPAVLAFGNGSWSPKNMKGWKSSAVKKIRTALEKNPEIQLVMIDEHRTSKVSSPYVSRYLREPPPRQTLPKLLQHQTPAKTPAFRLIRHQLNDSDDEEIDLTGASDGGLGDSDTGESEDETDLPQSMSAAERRRLVNEKKDWLKKCEMRELKGQNIHAVKYCEKTNKMLNRDESASPNMGMCNCYERVHGEGTRPPPLSH
ncbi:hypothetical protein HK097_007562 [Rhizophlyctis rosea]|uniref:OTU domain-containing protein n=1 Tax=Rhizophlyctis rosea TaxID=64517 RepID=A0AAD5SBF2_9FUNG|nr:hypothetical protein HK097_007562 [Rhizophlyctis rosea]